MDKGIFPSPVTSDCVTLHTYHGLWTLGIGPGVQENSQDYETCLPPAVRLRTWARAD